MGESSLFLRFGTALFIGILIGLQREYAFDDPKKEIAAGVRTFPLLALIGCASAYASETLCTVWIFVSAIVCVSAFLAISYYVDASKGKIGLTTKTAALATVIIGGLCCVSRLTLPVALGVAVLALLSVKIELHRFAHRITRADVYATLKFAMVSAIILPVLPDRSFGPAPFTIFNPFKIWLFVVLISGISFVGYLLVKVAGSEKGIELTGLMGGLASSTAVTLSFTRRSQQNPELSSPFALATTIAWTVMYARVVAVVAVLNSSLVPSLWLPLLVPVVVGLAYCFYLRRREKGHKHKHEVAVSNPFELGFAIKFGLLFAVILFVARAAQVYIGDTGIYLSGFFAGLADVDAISLSMAKLSRGAGAIDPLIAVRAIVIATVANTILKGTIATVWGAAGLRRAIAPGFILMVLTGAAAVMLVR